MEMIEYIMLGVLMGFLTATSGCLKDINWEPFELRKYIRSIYLTGIGGIICYLWFPDERPIMVMAFSFLFERLFFEIYKAFIRPPIRPSKFADPQRDTRWIIRKLRGEL